MIKVERDHECEMMRISIDGNVVFEGSFWDICDDDWISILEKAGNEVSDVKYQYA